MIGECQCCGRMAELSFYGFMGEDMLACVLCTGEANEQDYAIFYHIDKEMEARKILKFLARKEYVGYWDRSTHKIGVIVGKFGTDATKRMLWRAMEK